MRPADATKYSYDVPEQLQAVTGFVNWCWPARLVSKLSIDDPLYGRTVPASRGITHSSIRGRVGEGIGSPYAPAGFVWPLSTIARALTSADRQEVARQMLGLVASSGEDGSIHESFDPNDSRRFTRAEFGWANAMYAELLFRTAANFAVQPQHRPRTALHGFFAGSA